MARPTMADPLGVCGPDEPDWIAEKLARRRRIERERKAAAYRAYVAANYPWIGSMALQSAILVVLILILLR